MDQTASAVSVMMKMAARSIGRGVCVLAALLICSGAIAAEKSFTGDDAAYVDWAWKNCGMQSTPKERGLVDRANANAGDAFQRSYTAQYNKITAQAKDQAETKRVCETVNGWYGPTGSRIAELVGAKNVKPDSPGVSTSATSKSAGEKGGGRRGGKRGGM
jgi:hypothetical protein